MHSTALKKSELNSKELPPAEQRRIHGGTVVKLATAPKAVDATYWLVVLAATGDRQPDDSSPRFKSDDYSHVVPATLPCGRATLHVHVKTDDTALDVATKTSGCASYRLQHSGCAPKNVSRMQCIKSIDLKLHSAGGGPPYGQRFMYDTGGRMISTSMWSTVAACALQCYGEPLCAGFVNVNNVSCITVNDTTHHVGTGEKADSYVVVKELDCKVDCRRLDGMMFGLPADTEIRPVAMEGGTKQCFQYCDLDPNCTGIVVLDDSTALGGGGSYGVFNCQLVTKSGMDNPVHTILKIQSWLKSSTTGSPMGEEWAETGL